MRYVPDGYAERVYRWLVWRKRKGLCVCAFWVVVAAVNTALHSVYNLLGGNVFVLVAQLVFTVFYGVVLCNEVA